MEYYRERYSTTGIFENRPYPGVEKMLQELRRKKYLLAVASSKPEYYVKQILDYFNLTEYFDEIVGSEMNGARTNKTEVIEETLKRLGLDHHREQVIMVVTGLRVIRAFAREDFQEKKFASENAVYADNSNKLFKLTGLTEPDRKSVV